MSTDPRTAAVALSLLGQEKWLINEDLGGSLTGTRDDELRFQYEEAATEILAAIDEAVAEEGDELAATDDAALARIASAAYEADRKRLDFPPALFRQAPEPVRHTYFGIVRIATGKP